MYVLALPFWRNIPTNTREMPPPPLNPVPYEIGQEITYYSAIYGERQGLIRGILNSEQNENPYRWYEIVQDNVQFADPAAMSRMVSYLMVERTNDGGYAGGFPSARQQQGGRTRRVRRASRKSRRVAKHRHRR